MDPAPESETSREGAGLESDELESDELESDGLESVEVSEVDSAQRRRILLLIAYDGSPYGGFQQQDNRATIAGILDRAIASIDPNASRLIGSSRTDAGVHAKLQPVSFTTTRRISSRGWVHALLPYLPHDIAVLYAAKVPFDFDPRKSPRWKTYRYRVLCSEVDDPFQRDRSWRIREPLDLGLMQAEASELVGEHDFAAFRSAKDLRTTTVRNLREVSVERAKDDRRCLDISVTGDRFMYNMVRIIVGTLVDIGRGKLAPGAVRRALTSLSRVELGVTAPPFGLCLDHVELDFFGDDPWPSLEQTLGAHRK